MMIPARPSGMASRRAASIARIAVLVVFALFFVVPLYLSIALGLSAVDTGVRILPLSITLLVAALGIPKFLPNVSPLSMSWPYAPCN